jgi:RIO-like serine/threonine protein kinase
MADKDAFEGIVNVLRKKLQDRGIRADHLELLQRGNYGNANVYRYFDGRRDLIIKEFISRTWLIRSTLGRFYIHRELKALSRLKNLPGVPEQACRLGAHALCYSFIKGNALSSLTKEGVKLPKAFFVELETRLKQIHQAGFAHLDVRNLGNIIQSQDGEPYLIDFQSCVGTRHFPSVMLMIAEDADLSGVYKSWKKLCEEPLDRDRAAFLEMVNRRRRLWFLKGYALGKATHRGKKHLRRRFRSV